MVIIGWTFEAPINKMHGTKMFQNWCFWVVYTCSKTLFTIISASSNHESKSSLKPPHRCVLYYMYR